MTIYDMIFIINLVILTCITIYHCFKKDFKAIIGNIVVLSLFLAIKYAQINYNAIRAYIYEALGEELFGDFRDLISAVLFFGTSVTVSVQLLGELAGIFMLLALAAKAAVIFVKKGAKKIFGASVFPEDEKPVDNNDLSGQLFLVYGRLLN